jgi:molecular chaperone GrpE
VSEKNRSQPADLEPEPDEESPANARVYDVDSGDTPPTEATEEVRAEEEEPEPEASPGRGRSRISRREILDRFQSKNAAIARLTKENAALEKSRSELEASVRDLKDKWLRTAAEFENHRKRTAKEWELLKQQTRSEVILEVLGSLDDFERAFAVVEGQEESEFVRGIRLIYNNLLQVLQKLGVAEIEALHEPFDPTCHMAVGQIETTEIKSGRVAEVVEKGYSLNGTVIRPARVIVAK